MLGYMVRKSLRQNLGPSLWLGMTLGSCAVLITLFSGISVEVKDKIGATVSQSGANAVAYPNPYMTQKKGEEVWKIFSERVRKADGRFVFLKKQIAKIEGKEIEVVMADPEKLFVIKSYWAVTGRSMHDPGDAMIGRRVAEFFGMMPGQKFSLIWGGKPLPLQIRGVIDSGDEDEYKIFMTPWLQKDMSLTAEVSLALLSIPGGEEGMNAFQKTLDDKRTGLTIKPYRQVLYGQRMILDKVGLLTGLVLIGVILMTALGMTAALMAHVLQRRKELALMRALGANSLFLIRFLFLEAGLVGLAGAVIGFGIGTILTYDVVWKIFHMTVLPRYESLSMTIGLVMGIVFFAAGIASFRAVRLQPAVSLRGE